MTHIVEAEGLTAHYGGRTALRDVSFTVDEGESVAVLGANGAGKSTLFACLLGLHPHDGQVRLFGAKRSRKALADVGMVFQNPEDQLFLPSILEDVVLPLRNRGVSREQAERRGREALASTGMLVCAEIPAHRLSWGQRKRAAIASALAMGPRLLILDEPTSELDGRSVRELAGVLNALAVTKLMASHHLEFVRQTANRCLLLMEGQLAVHGDVRDMLANTELLRAAGLM